jgi:hypothetical protein
LSKATYKIDNVVKTTLQGEKMTKNALVINSELKEDDNSAWVDVQARAIDIAEGEELRNLQREVGGLVQPIDLTPTITMWCNEEGKMIGLPLNYAATRIWTKFFGNTDYIMGQVVFTGGTGDEGETLPLSKEDEQVILGWVK